MKVWKVVLPLVILFLAGTVLAQDSPSPSFADNVSHEDVIVPWTHFGQKLTPAPSVAPNDPPAPQAATTSPEANDPDNAAVDPPSPAEPGQDLQSTQTPVAGQNAQIYEADISKKHPHPPEPVELPPAAQVAAPLTQSSPMIVNLKSGNPTQNGTSTQPGTNTEGAGEAPQASTPESQILAAVASYQNREASRAAQVEELQAAAAKDPSAQLRAQIQETQLLLGGEQDRMQTAQELSKAYASLAGELADRAGKMSGLADSRAQGAQAAEAELNEMKGIMPGLDLALHNFAMLPPGDENNHMIGTLGAELAQDENSRQINQERSVETQNEAKALQADAQQLEQAAATARQKSAQYVQESQEARAKEGLLSGRLEYLVARQGATDMLANASKVLGAEPVASQAVLPSAPNEATGPSSPAGQSVDRLRSCLRNSASADACVTNGGPKP